MDTRSTSSIWECRLGQAKRKKVINIANNTNIKLKISSVLIQLNKVITDNIQNYLNTYIVRFKFQMASDDITPKNINI